MKNIKTVCSIACFLFNLTLFGDAIISMQFKPYPIMPSKEYCNELSHTLATPGIIADRCLHGILDKKSVVGVFATYGGFLNVSDAQGELSFPLKHAKKSLQILVTPRITPILMAGNTIHHWEIDPGSPAALFTLEQKKDEETQSFYWDAQEGTVPQNNIIPVQTLIIIAQPKHVYIPTGITPALENPSLILPPIYVKRGINHVVDGLYMLNVNHLFSPVSYRSKTDAAHFSNQVITGGY